MKRKLKVDLDDIVEAFENADPDNELEFYLDLESGEVFLVTADLRFACESLQEEAEESGRSFAEVLAEVDDKDWTKKEMPFVARAINDDGTVLFIPPQESSDAYEDMAAFADSLGVTPIGDELRMALRGSRPFRRFKDVLGRHDEERTRWFAFEAECDRKHALEWLEEEGIEVID